MRKILIGVGTVIVLLVVAAIAVPFLIPADTYVSKVAAAVKQATGRDLKVAGPVSFHLLPDISLTASTVSLSNAPGSADSDFATIGKLDVGLKLMPLLSKKIEISHLTLTQPIIHLEVNKAGQANWSFQPAPGAAPVKTAKPAEAPPEEAAPEGGMAAQLQQLSLGTVKISDGTFTYLDARTGKKEEADKLDATLSLPSIKDKLSLTASATYKGQSLDADITAAKAAALIDGSGTEVGVKLSSSLFKLALDGQAKAAKSFGFTGKIDLSSPSVRNLAAWAGTPLKLSGTGLGPLSLTGKLTVEGASLSLSGMALSLDAIKASGALAVNANGARPVIKGNLELGALDLNPYLAPAPQGNAAPASEPIAAPETPGTGWSEAPIDASALKSADADLTLALTSLHFHTIDIGKTALNLSLGNGRLAITFKQLTLYGGGGTGRIALDGSQPGIGFETQIALDKVQMEPLLMATIGIDKFTGTGKVNIDLNGHGRSQAQLMAGLGGKGAMSINNGVIKGIDLVAIEHKPLQGLTESSGTAQTPFTALSGTFTAAGGSLINQDLLLDSPGIGLSGKGTIDVFHRTLSYRVEPNLPSGIQGGKSGIYGTAVPIVIEGPWTKLSYRPDVQAVLQQKAQKMLGSQVDKLLGNKNGQSGSGANGTSGGGTNGAAGSLLKGLLGH